MSTATAPHVRDVLAGLARDPWTRIVRRWNWKSAATSASVRGVIFFLVNIGAGPAAALSALTTEMLFRVSTSGFYGAITESFRFARPGWLATLTAAFVLPIVSHALEFLVHLTRGTANLGASIGASIAFTVLSTAFNLHAMRHGALVVGEGRQPLWRDLVRMPRIFGSFVLMLVRSLAGALRVLFRQAVRAGFEPRPTKSNALS